MRNRLMRTATPQERLHEAYERWADIRQMLRYELTDDERSAYKKDLSEALKEYRDAMRAVKGLPRKSP
jgi:hypothetical protein